MCIIVSPKSWFSLQANLSISAQESIERLNNLVVIEDWIQTPAVLSHPNVVLFVSHCGANGLNEALVTATPVLGLPLFGKKIFYIYTKNLYIFYA